MTHASHWLRRAAGPGAIALLAALAVAAGGSASTHVARGAGVPCEDTASARCLTVTVPLDRSGRVPGQVGLHVEVTRAKGKERGVVFLVAGGPGQAATDLAGSNLIGLLYGLVFPGYTVVAFDARGTGRSGVLHCPQVRLDVPDTTGVVSSCATALGPRRDFYGTADNAEDIDAVRTALGYNRIALSAVSYGTEVAVAYARAHPSHLERMLLDSVSPLDQHNPFAGRQLGRIPATLRRFCGGAVCKRTSRDFAGDVTALSNRLEREPIHGSVRRTDGSRTVARVKGSNLLQLVLDADLNPGLAAELPAAVHAARYGDAGPLLRLWQLESGGQPLGVNGGLYLATRCHDGRFPWKPDTPLSQRRAAYDRALAALPRNALGGFGSWAARFGDAYSCLSWPSPAGGTALSQGPLPDVPVLVLSGGFDLRTPTADGAALAARFNRGRLVVFPGVGHSVLGNEATGCALGAVRDWVLTGTVAKWQGCPRRDAFIAPLRAFPVASAGRAAPGQTLDLAERTLHEAVATWLMTASPTGRIRATPGLDHGTVTTSLRHVILAHYGIAPGVYVSGTVTLSMLPPLRFSGELRVEGPQAANGELSIDGETVKGELGGEAVGDSTFCVTAC